MHEWSIVESLLDRVEAEVRDRGATRVHRLRVRLGALSGVEPVLLASAYEVFRVGTACATAPLDVVTGGPRWRCTRCAVALPPESSLECPCCHGRRDLAAADEIVLERIEMEVP